ncbi:hypothetical protein ACWCQ0_15810 [Streptomyces massasporeus]|uniref:Uncharacterized protein n=1 Tax=Streptomyces massasporeus TaxID=67324 RepID=A0ABW6L598_9ACTN
MPDAPRRREARRRRRPTRPGDKKPAAEASGATRLRATHHTAPAPLDPAAGSLPHEGADVLPRQGDARPAERGPAVYGGARTP